MPSQVLRLDRRIEPQTSSRGGFVERRLARYRPELQLAVRSLARRHPRLADLAASFPALLVGLAVPRAGFNPAPVVARVIHGPPLGELAKAAEIPLWLRKFPPEFFSDVVPHLPDNHDFCCRLMNHLPRSPKFAPVWLQAVANAVAWADEPFAIWIAGNLVHNRGVLNVDRLPLVCLWAWFSVRPETFAHGLIERTWSPGMQAKTALGAANDWLTAVTLYANLGDEPISDMWTEPGTVDGYDFVPLRSIADVNEEARAMRNCIRTYGACLALNSSRLWSIRKDGQRIATVEIARSIDDPLLHVHEVKTEGNRAASKEIWWIARRWLHSHNLPEIDPKMLSWTTGPLRRGPWIKLWKPYWLAKRRFPNWLPVIPSRYALDAL
jgi:hypothetical protein